MKYKALHLEENENVIFEVRKHWIVFVGYALILFFVALMPVVVLLFFKYFANSISLGVPEGFYPLFSFFYFIWILSLWIFFFIDWTKYYLDVWYVTQKRIIIINQRGMFDREISNVRFDKIQDVTINVDGVFATFLDFGNIRVQTASEDNTEFLLTTVRHPGEVRKIIFTQHNIISEVGNTKG